MNNSYVHSSIYHLVSVEYFHLDDEIDRKIDVTAILFLLVQNRQQTQDWTLIGSGANGLGIRSDMPVAELNV